MSACVGPPGFGRDGTGTQTGFGGVLYSSLSLSTSAARAIRAARPGQRCGAVAAVSEAGTALVIRPGNSATHSVVKAAMPAVTVSSAPKPAAFTVGPSTYTASELTPNDTARRMPATRERIRSSTYCTIIASTKGMAPNTKIMNARTVAYSRQPSAGAATRKSGAWAATIGR